MPIKWKSPMLKITQAIKYIMYSLEGLLLLHNFGYVSLDVLLKTIHP